MANKSLTPPGSFTDADHLPLAGAAIHLIKAPNAQPIVSQPLRLQLTRHRAQSCRSQILRIETPPRRIGADCACRSATAAGGLSGDA